MDHRQRLHRPVIWWILIGVGVTVVAVIAAILGTLLVFAWIASSEEFIDE